MEELLCAYAMAPAPKETHRSNVVAAQTRFK
jgi:hypothetical protein